MKEFNAIRNVDLNHVGWCHPSTYTWHKGCVHPYASLWLTVLRFSLLNRPKFETLRMELRTTLDDRVTGGVRLASEVPWPNHEFVNLRFFVEKLGEKIESFRWSSIGDFPKNVNSSLFFNTQRFCSACLLNGYHTVVFSMRGLNKCPLHDEKLIDWCPDCRVSFRFTMRPSVFIPAPICKCLKSWITIENARHPPADSDRDAAIGEVVQWLEHVGRIGWMQYPSRDVEFIRVEPEFECISRCLMDRGEAMPKWVDIPIRPICFGTDQLRVDLRSGFAISKLERLFEHPRLQTAKRNSYSKYRMPYSIFKSFRRYAFKHLLGNRIHLIYWLIENYSPQLLRQKMQDVRYMETARAILYCMQCSFWLNDGVCLWINNLREPPKREKRFREMPSVGLRPVQRTVVSGAKVQAEQWIQDWVNGSALLDQWPSKEDLNWCSSDQAFIQATHRIPARDPIQWWARTDDDRHIRLALVLRLPGFRNLEAHRCPHKRIRQTNAAALVDERQKMLHKQMTASAIEFYSDGSCAFQGELQLLSHGFVRCSRLVMGAGIYYRFGVAQLHPNETHPNDKWLLRCLDYPVVVISASTHEGVLRLKRSVRQYVRSISRTADAASRTTATE